ncbi:MAG: hypothetical protein Q4Q19_05745 [Methanobrevibacter sp.]|nr:hypothetical protein [Methanobrevibacter sp.]
MLEIVKDERGFLSLFDSLLALFLVFVVFIAFNMVMEIEVPSLSEENKDFKTSQDLMEILSSKATDRDYSTLEIISYTLDYNNNSLASQREVTGILDEFFSIYLSSGSYSFVETSQLGGKVLSSRGNVMDGDEVTVAIRYYGNYYY